MRYFCITAYDGSFPLLIQKLVNDSTYSKFLLSHLEANRYFCAQHHWTSNTTPKCMPGIHVVSTSMHSIMQSCITTLAKTLGSTITALSVSSRFCLQGIGRKCRSFYCLQSARKLPILIFQQNLIFFSFELHCHFFNINYQSWLHIKWRSSVL